MGGIVGIHWKVSHRFIVRLNPSLTNVPRSGKHMVLDNRPVIELQFSTWEKICSGPLKIVLNEYLEMSKLSSSLVERIMSPKWNDNQVECCHEILSRMDADDQSSHGHFGDEGWKVDSPGIWEQAKQLALETPPIFTSWKLEISASKVMAAIFGDEDRVVFYLKLQ